MISAATEQDARRREVYATCTGQPPATYFTPTEANVLGGLIRPESAEVARERGLNLTRARQALFDANSRERAALAEAVSAGAATPTKASDPESCDPRLGPTGEVAAEASLVASYRTEVLSDPQLVAARRAWSACVAHAGYPAGDVVELATSISAEAAPRAAAYMDGMTAAQRAEFDDATLATERQAALAVVECDRSAFAPVVAVWAKVERRWLAADGAGFERLDAAARALFASKVGF